MALQHAHIRCSGVLFASVLCASFAAAAADEGPVEEVYVWGLRAQQVGQALAASEGVVSFAGFADRPLLRPAELLEVIPGFAATQHSGSGKANQYFVRGFNLDHGTDFSAFLDGVPLNLPSHAHGQGYLDLNPLAPELVGTIAYRKGPYFADAGDFSSAGTAALELVPQLPASFAETVIGEGAYARLLGAVRFGENAYLAADLTRNDGPSDDPEDLRKASLLGRFADGALRLTALVYNASWDATDQIPQRSVASGDISRFGFIDPTDGGETTRLLLSARYADALSGWEALGYLQYYTVNLWSNFTYFLDDPAHGDQFEQSERRWITGGTLTKDWDTASGWELRAGAQTRLDEIGEVALAHTEARQRLSLVRSDAVAEMSGAVWADAVRRWERFRASVGARVDGFYVDVDSNDPRNSGSEQDGLFSPKLAIAWQAAPQLEFYADAGRGFHSNDARGATIMVDPASGMPVERVPLLVPGTGGELGARWDTGAFGASITAWWLKLDSELVFVGDAGTTEPSDASERTGLEVVGQWRPDPRLHVDISAAATRARFLGNPPAGSRIPNALEYVVTGGVSALITPQLTATLTLRHLGPAPLIEDNSVRATPATLTNALLRWRGGRFTLTGEVLNLFDSDANDIQYFYASRLPSEPMEGVEDRHVHPAEPRMFRVGLRVEL
jgi:hypothetical protein